MRNRIIAAAACALLAAGCSEIAGSKSQGRVAVRFSTAGSTASRSLIGDASFDVAPSSGDELVLTGSNGTLRIDDIRMIVSKFELKRVSGACVGREHDEGDDEGDDDHDEKECDEFEGGPFLLDLPLSGGSVTVSTDVVPEGTYSAVKFEVEDLEADDDDDAKERSSFQGILSTLRQSYPAFPSRGSMVVHGTFTPTGGTPQPFTTYFRAELEIEKALEPPLVVPGEKALTVSVDPARWFSGSGRVMNLAALNGRTVDFEIREGFRQARSERD